MLYFNNPASTFNITILINFAPKSHVPAHGTMHLLSTAVCVDTMITWPVPSTFAKEKRETYTIRKNTWRVICVYINAHTFISTGQFLVTHLLTGCDRILTRLPRFRAQNFQQRSLPARTPRNNIRPSGTVNTRTRVALLNTVVPSAPQSPTARSPTDKPRQERLPRPTPNYPSLLPAIANPLEVNSTSAAWSCMTAFFANMLAAIQRPTARLCTFETRRIPDALDWAFCFTAIAGPHDECRAGRAWTRVAEEGAEVRAATVALAGTGLVAAVRRGIPVQIRITLFTWK